MDTEISFSGIGKAGRIRWLTSVGLVCLFLGIAVLSVGAAPPESGLNVVTTPVRNSSNVSYSTYNDWVSTSIVISGYASNITVAEAGVRWNVDSDAVGEVEYKLRYENAAGTYTWESPPTDTWMDPTGNDAADGYAETSEAGLPYWEGLDGQYNDLPIDIPINGTWTFFIRDTVNNGNNRGRLDWWEIYFKYIPPPTGVTATDGTDTSVTVTWNYVDDWYLDHYTVYRSTTAGGTKTYVGSRTQGYIVPTYSLVDNGTIAYRQYYYYVRSCNQFGCAWFSTSDTGNSMLVPPPISATEGTYTDKVRVTFTEDTRATFYEVWRSTSAAGPYSKVGQTLDYTEVYDDTSVAPGTLYYYKGKSCTAYGCSGLSFFWDYGMASAEPPAVQASDGEFWYVYLEWEQMPGAHTYRVYRSTTTTPPDPADYYARDIYDTCYPVTPCEPQHWYDYGAEPYTTYYYWVVSCLEPTCSSLDEYDSGWRIYRQPYNVAASDGTYTDKVEVTWGSDDAVDFYKVYRADTAGGERILLGTTAGMSFNDLDATPGMTYYYSVLACDADFCSNSSAENSGWRAWTVPENIQASDGTSTAWTEVTWDAQPYSTSYKVFRCTGTGTGSCGSAIGNPTGLSFNDTGALPGVDYYYRVKACAGSTNCSDYSAYEAGWRLPAAPVNVQASDGDFTTKIQILWNAVSGVTSYELYRYIDSVGPPNHIADPAGTIYDDTAPSPGRTYWYWVKACGLDHCSELSENDDGWRSIIAPENVQASDGTYLDKVAISWDAVGAAATYRVYRADSQAGTKVQIGNPSTNSFDDTTAFPGMTYYYWITSCAWGKCGDYSAFDTGWRFGFLIFLPLIMR